MSKPKVVTGVVILGPATMQIIKANDLIDVVPLLILIVQNKPASHWGKLLSMLSLPDKVHSSLLDAMSEDWIVEEMTKAGSEGSDED